MTEPTDAEIIAVMRDGYNCRYNDEQDHVDFARAVLAKWGTPAGAGEVVACGNCDGTGWMVRDPDIGTDQECFVCDGSGGYSESATPQPTQAQVGAVPLTDEQIEALPLWKRFVGLWPETRREIVRTIERHHGIKGGQQ